MVLGKQKHEESGGPDGTKRQDHRLWGWESWKNRGLWSADDLSQVEMNENDGPEPKMSQQRAKMDTSRRRVRREVSGTEFPPPAFSAFTGLCTVTLCIE